MSSDDKKKNNKTSSIVEYDPLKSYLSEISRYSLLTREEEKELSLLVYEENDSGAAYKMVTANLRLVVKIAFEFQRIWMQNLFDLIQEGNIGLMQAVKKFNPYKGVKFSYYASFWIKAYILKFIMDNWKLVRIGTTQAQRKLFFRLKKEKQKLIDKGFEPTSKLLASELGVTEKEVVNMDQRLNSWDLSLDLPVKEDSKTQNIEIFEVEEDSVEDVFAREEIKRTLNEHIKDFKKELNEREIIIFEKRLFSDEPLTLQTIGDQYGISRERVRQVENNVIKKIRKFLKEKITDFKFYAQLPPKD